MRNPDRETTFRFKQFEVSNCRSAMKVGTDGVLLGAWAFAGIDSDKPLRVLDAGCGTGLLMLMLAQRFANAELTGIEIDDDAASEAAANCARSPWSGRLKVECGDFAALTTVAASGGNRDGERWDLIVSNPPFFSNGALAPALSRRTARHETALNADTLIAFAGRKLAPEGRLAMVLPDEYRERIEFAATLGGLEVTRLCRVRTVANKPPRRLLVELAHTGAHSAHQQQRDELVLKNADGTPTPDYASLVDPFYIKI